MVERVINKMIKKSKETKVRLINNFFIFIS
jgi:hypothetical protein